MEKTVITICLFISMVFFNIKAYAASWETFNLSSVMDKTGLVGTHHVVVGILGDPIEGCTSLSIVTGTSTAINVPDDEYGAAAVNRAYSLALTALTRGKEITVLKESGQCYFKLIQTDIVE